jgi:hypothetical protein
MRVGVAPLDERPVNARLPGMVAAVAGAETVLPPDDMLPDRREPGDADAIGRWLTEVAGEVDALVVSLDLLGYGGLIASRTSAEPVDVVVRRLAALEGIRAEHPRLPIAAVATVLRASRSYSAAEEPEYWTAHGVELHDYGSALHSDYLDEPSDVDNLRAAIPEAVRRDFLWRRARNHAVNLHALTLASAGVLDPLLVTADDTAPRSAGSLEQLWLAHWVRALKLDERVLSYPGADEVGAVLVARCLARAADLRPRIAVSIAEPGGAERVAPYENVPVATTCARHVAAAGAEAVDQQADAVLVVHAPAADGGDWGRPAVTPTPDDVVARVVRSVDGLLARGVAVGLADVRYANGADDRLVAALHDAGLLWRLAAYGGWNTAGNTIGSVVAALVARCAALRSGTLDAAAERALLGHRVAEDYGYQAVVRTALGRRPEYAERFAEPFADAPATAAYLAACHDGLTSALAGIDGGGWLLEDLRLPWDRTFEIDFVLTPTTRREPT